MKCSSQLNQRDRAQYILSQLDIFMHLYKSYSSLNILTIFGILKVSVSAAAAAATKSLQSCPTLCNPIDSSPSGSAVPGIFQARTNGVGCHFLLQCMKVKSESEVAQSCPTLSDPMDCSLPGSSIHEIFQARVLEWGATVAQSCPTLCDSMDYIVQGILQARILEWVA